MANQPSFEDSLEKLDHIVSQMESGDLKLEDSLKYFEDGMRLTRECNLRLNEIEKKVKQLLKTVKSKAGDSGTNKPSKG
jgi:exodeoxyribonuclease VII small subunit